jgi:hypothetical protein
MIYNNRKKLLLLVGVLMLVFAVQFVAAAEASDSFVGDTKALLEKWNLLPGNLVGNDVLWIFIAIFGSIVLVLIIADILMLVSPWSDYINWVIAGGIFVVLVLTGALRNLVGVVFILAGTIFGVGSGLALIMTAIMFFAAIIFIFFGNLKIQKWLVDVKGRKGILHAQKKAHKAAEDVVAGATVMGDVGEATT